MKTPSHHEVSKALTEIVHEELVHRRAVTLPGWGTLTIERHPGHTEAHDGQTSVHPPKETVIFQSESS